MHRALFVRNRDPKLLVAPSHACRLKCGDPDESMLHMILCMQTRPYWNAVKAFLRDVLGIQNMQYTDRLIIFNTVRGEMISTEACAFIRHAVNCFYRDFAMVDTHDKKFTWQLTFADAMHSFRSAVFAWAQTIRVFTAVRRYSGSKKKQVPRDTLRRFEKLVTFSDTGTTFTLTPQFQQAITHANAAARTQAGNGP